jgi:murein DD-endopeptidase MepM/ murein hydrolase activator NlpD
MSIFKSSFRSGIITQIEKRESAIAGDTRTPQTIQYYNARNSWIRMTSGVNVGSDKGALAKAGVLLAGNTRFGSSLKSGIGNTNDSVYSTKSPGGGNHRLGIRPMPGIISLEVKSKSAYGSLREAIISFQCWDIRQLEELEKLYMRPGFTVMVEWGWMPYLDDKGALKNDSATRFNNSVLNGGVTKERIWKQIFDESKDGNYDAVYGFVRNFSWSARPDGGYDCTTTLITMGEVAESLKINYGAFDSSIKIREKGLFGTTSASLPTIWKLPALGIPFPAFATAPKENVVQNAYAENIVAGICAELYSYAEKDTTPAPTPILFKDSIENVNYDLAKIKLEINNFPKQGPSITTGDTQVYILLSDFLYILSAHVLLADQDDSITEISTYAADNDYDFSFYGDPLLCLADRHQISTNPYVCLIKNKAYEDPEGYLRIKNLNIKGLLTNQYPALSEYYLDITNKDVDPNVGEFGTIGNIYVNLDYIYSLSISGELGDKDKNEKNDINLYDFIKGMMDGINASIGNVANFDIHIDPIDSIARIIDVHYVEKKTRANAYDDIQKNKIQIGNKQSIVRNYRLESMIFPEQMTMIAIGAQVQGGALATNTNTLIDYNKNLTDRIVTQRIAPVTIAGGVVTTFEDRLDEVQANYAILSELFLELVPDWWDFGVGDYDIEQAARYSNALKDIISFFSTYTQNDNSNRDILPTRLSLEMDGIGGMIIGNMFSVNEDAIPEGYKGGTTGVKTGYLVTGLAHSLRDNDWATTVDAQFVVLDSPQTNRIPWSDIPVLDAADFIRGTAASSNPTSPPPPAAAYASSWNFQLPLVFTTAGDTITITSLLNRATAKTKGNPVVVVRRHEGIDLVGKLNDRILAVQDGTVIFSGVQRAGGGQTELPKNGISTETLDGWGYYMILKHELTSGGTTKIFYSLYGHMVAGSQSFQKGEIIAKNTVIGKVGSTGDSGGPHLHFELGETLNGNTVGGILDPIDWLPFFEDPANPGQGFIPATATIIPGTTYTKS